LQTRKLSALLTVLAG